MISAAQAGDIVLLQQLLNNGHSVNETNFDCVTPLHEACLAGRLDCVQFLLLSGANVSVNFSLIIDCIVTTFSQLVPCYFCGSFYRAKQLC